MKRLLFPLFLAVAVTSCGGGEHKDHADDADTLAAVDSAPVMAFFGAEINEDGAMAATNIATELGDQDSVELKVVGTVEKVCQVKGCWMTMNIGQPEGMRVTFKDYGFFVPKDIDGKEVVIQGKAFVETTSVEDLRHYAEDEGLGSEEIEAITEPETNITFVADGVIVKDYEVKTGSAEEGEQHLEDAHGHDHDHDHADHM